MEHSLNLTSVGNARELGGYVVGDGTVRHGLLLRTGKLSRLSEYKNKMREKLEDL